MILSMTTLINVARFVSTLQRKRNFVIFPCNLRKQMHANSSRKNARHSFYQLKKFFVPCAGGCQENRTQPIAEEASIHCYKLILYPEISARNRGDWATEAATRRRNRTGEVDDDERRRRGEIVGKGEVAVEQKLKYLHPWQNQQPVDTDSRLPLSQRQ